MKYDIIFERRAKEEDKNNLYLQMERYNKKITSLYKNHYYYNYFIKNDGKLLGGIEGHIWLGINHIDRLFIHERIRGQGYGKQLLKKAEDFGKEQKAFSIALENISFQNTLEFYLSQGFCVVYEEEAQQGMTLYHLRKQLC